MLTTNFTDGLDRARAVAIEADGKIGAAGASGKGEGNFDSRFALARYETDGAPPRCARAHTSVRSMTNVREASPIPSRSRSRSCRTARLPYQSSTEECPRTERSDASQALQAAHSGMHRQEVTRDPTGTSFSTVRKGPWQRGQRP